MQESQNLCLGDQQKIIEYLREENRVLKAQLQNQRLRLTDGEDIPPSTERATSWQTFLRAHWDAVAAVDFFTTAKVARSV